VTDDARQEQASSLAWSPDGSSLIFNHRTDELPVGIVEMTGASPRIFMTARGLDVDFRPSPDGTTVLFESIRSGNPDLWSAPVAGGEPRRLTRSPQPDVLGRWSPDGLTIAFQSRRAGNFDIYTMSSEGENVVQLTSWPGQELVPQWSPDGSTIAFISNHEATEQDIWTVPATGGEPTRITNLDAQIFGPSVRWSPDGQDLIFGTNPSPSDPRQTLNRVSSTGGPVLELFEGDHNGVEWSPDGQELALAIVEDGYRHLHVMPATGGTPRRLTDGEREWDNFPQWSDDGSEIIYMRQLYESGRGDIPVISAVSVADGTIRTVVGDSTNAFGLARLLESEGGESVLYVIQEGDLPVDEVRIADLLADLESEGN
jgi:TolB protein